MTSGSHSLLPSPAADPLQVFPPWLPGWLLAVVVVALFALWLWRLSFRRLATAPRNRSASIVDDGFRGLVQRIEHHHSKHKSFRRGCHELSAAVKTRLEELTRLEMEEMTAGEIVALVRNTEIRTLMSDLRAHQFGRRPPRQSDFVELCRLAEQTLADTVQIPIAEPDALTLGRTMTSESPER